MVGVTGYKVADAVERVEVRGDEDMDSDAIN